MIVIDSVFGTSYPSNGLAIEWAQPDGTVLKLRVIGDEYYARTVTEEGFTVKYDDVLLRYDYAILAEDKKSLICSGFPAHLPPPSGMIRGLLEPVEAIERIRLDRMGQIEVERGRRWEARVKAAQNRRAGQGGGLVKAIAGAQEGQVKGSMLGLMILAEFPDDPTTPALDPIRFPTSQSKIERFCNDLGYTEDGNTGSIRRYFWDQSGGRFDLNHIVTAVVLLPQPQRFYNIDPSTGKLRQTCDAGGTIVTDAVNVLKSSGFDFSKFSVDSRGEIIATSLLWAGPVPGTWDAGLWPHRCAVNPISVGTINNPRYISGYQVTDLPNTTPAIGTICHELGHLILSFPDLYDADKQNGESAGLGYHCLMASGNQLNGKRTPGPLNLYFKDVLGWADITNLGPGASLSSVLPSVGNRGYRVFKTGSLSEFFLFENRGNAPEDPWAAHCIDRGIMIWHVDENYTNARGYANGDQQRTLDNHYHISLEQADGRFDLESKSGNNVGERGDSSDLYAVGSLVGHYDRDWWDRLWGLKGELKWTPTPTVFNDATNPSATWWDGTKSGLSFEVLDTIQPTMRIQFGAREVTNLADSGVGSLRWALASPTGGTIRFDPQLSGETILILSELRIDRNVRIDASNLEKGITLSGATLPTNRRLINISQPVDVSIKGLTFTFGNADRGGAIYSVARTLEVNSCTFHGNRASNLGSALFQNNPQPGGRCRIVNCTFTDNVAQRQGCLYNQVGEMILEHCTVAWNSNSGDTTGSGIVNERGHLKLLNTIVANNFYGATFPFFSDVHGDFTTLGPNIIRASTGDGVIVGGAIITRDPLLGDLADNGGPTLTMMPGSGSPAFGAGQRTPLILRDQRGFPRPARDGDNPAIGAVEVPFGPKLYTYQQEEGVLSAGDSARDFGHLLPGFTRSLEFGFANVGSSPLSGLMLSLTGPDASQFRIRDLPATEVAPQSSSTFTLEFAPTSEGHKMANLSIASNDPEANPFVIPLTGIGDSTFTLTHTSLGAPVWNRPEVGELPTVLSSTATATPYDVVSFAVDRAGDYIFTCTVTPFGQWENTLFLYAEAFDAREPLANILVGTQGPQSATFTHFLIPGIRYFVVTTGKTNGDAGTYQLMISGPSSVRIFAPAEILSPALGQSAVSIVPVFSWVNDPDAEYELFLGTSPGNLVSQGFQTSPFRMSSPLNFNTTYFWRLDTHQTGGMVTGRIYSFTTHSAILVTTESDENDPVLGMGIGDSLREVIAFAPQGQTTTIEFDPALSGKVIVLIGAELVITKNLTLDGSSLSDRITLNGNMASRIFSISTGASVVLRNLAITQGRASQGGGIQNNGGALSLEGCLLTGNQASNAGGGIYNSSGGSLQVVACTISNNTATEGGGIYNLSTGFMVRRSTFSGNGATSFGGGIYNSAENVLVETCTFHGNTSTVGMGGGLANRGNGNLTFRHCTLAENIGVGVINSAPASLTLDNTLMGNNLNTLNSLSDLQGNFTTIGANLVRVFNGTATGPSPIQADPLLEALTANGGSTRTMQPQPGSPAIDAGVLTSNTPSTDQENGFRPYGLAPDIGAVESRLNADTNLDWLTSSLGTLDPAFQPALTQYGISVPNRVTTAAVKASVSQHSQTLRVRINAGAFNELASRTASSEMPLVQGINLIEIEVTAESGARKSYFLSIVRGAPSANNTFLSSLSTSEGTLNPAFDPLVAEYRLYVPNLTTTTTVTASPANPLAELAVRVNFGAFNSLTPGVASLPLALKVGPNEIDIQVTAADGTSTAFHTLTITRESADTSNPHLSALSLSAGNLSPAFNRGRTLYQVDLSSQILSTTITAIPAAPGSTITARMNGGPFGPLTSGVPSAILPLSGGDNLIEVKVSAPDGKSVKSYSLILNRPLDHTEWVSKRRLAPAGQANDASGKPAVSSDGRFVAFASRATNLVVDDTNNSEDVFVFDRTLQTIERVSVNNAGQQGTYNGGNVGDSTNPSISADGRFIAFQSRADNLVPNDTNGQNDSSQGEDIFVFDRFTKTIERVSLRGDGSESNRPRAMTPSISGDGRYVAFVSGDNSSNMVEGFNTDGSNSNIYIYDRINRTTTGVSVPFGSLVANRDTLNPVFSSDGNYLAFEFAVESSMSPQYQYRDIYLYNRLTHGVERITGNKVGNAADRTDSRWPSISADGRYVAFESNLEDLDFYDSNSSVDIFVYDRLERRIGLISVDSSGANEGFSESTHASISGNGQFVTFESRASNLVSGDTNGSADVFMKDRLTGALSRVSVTSEGMQSDGDSLYSSLSFDGRIVAFESFATNLGPDTNESSDIFLVVTDAVNPGRLGGLASLTSNLEQLTPDFSLGVLSYLADVPYEMDVAYLRPIPVDSNGTMRIRVGNEVFHKVPSGDVARLSLQVGLNSIEIEVMTSDGSSTQTYAIAVTRAPSSNALLSDLTVYGQVINTEEAPMNFSLAPLFSSEITDYDIFVSNDSPFVEVVPVTSDREATVAINGIPMMTNLQTVTYNLNIGLNALNITVTAPNGVTQKAYNITIHRAASSDASLKNLVTDIGMLTPTFGSGTYYTIHVPAGLDSIRVTPTSSQPGSTVEINGQSVISGMPSPSITLFDGNNPISIEVTAQDGTTWQLYVLNALKVDALAGFASWAVANIPLGQDNSFGGDWNGDGISNGIAYVFGSAPFVSDSMGVFPTPPAIPLDVEVYLDRSTSLNPGDWVPIVSWIGETTPILTNGVTLESAEVHDTFGGSKAFYRYRVVMR